MGGALSPRWSPEKSDSDVRTQRRGAVRGRKPEGQRPKARWEQRVQGAPVCVRWEEDKLGPGTQLRGGQGDLVKSRPGRVGVEGYRGAGFQGGRKKNCLRINE